MFATKRGLALYCKTFLPWRIEAVLENLASTEHSLNLAATEAFHFL